jgi:hypothetical protein
MPEARLRVTCQRCKASYLVIVDAAPQLRVERNTCLFCGSRVHSTRELPSKTIDTFINTQSNNKELKLP